MEITLASYHVLLWKMNEHGQCENKPFGPNEDETET
jgi:hypothetical protein